MRIAIIGPTHPYKGGIAQHTTELAHRLTAGGHEVRIESWSHQYPARLYPGQQRVDVPEGTPFPATAHPLSWRRPDSWFRLGRRLRRRVPGAMVDLVVLVVVTPIQAPAYLGILAGLHGLRGRAAGAGPAVLALCHNVLPHERRAIDEPMISAVLRRCSAVLVHTDTQAELAGRLTTVPVRVAEMAPHLWRPSAAAAEAASNAASNAASKATSDAASDAAPVRVAADRAFGGAEPPARQLLFFGLVRPYKGLDVLLRALAQGPADVRLTVAGEFWGGVEATRGLVAELGLDERVELRPGYVPAQDVPGLFAAADALVLPYRAGTASQNVDLAHLHGRPVVATTVGTLAASVRDGVDGLLVPPDDPAALAAALRRLYEPGVLAALRAKVAPPDTDVAWDRYLDTVLAPSVPPAAVADGGVGRVEPVTGRPGKADCAP